MDEAEEWFRRSPPGRLRRLEACRVHGVPRLVLASSFYVYEQIDEGSTVDEETPLDLFAKGLFGAAKLTAERLVREYGAEYGLRCAILRCGSAFGPGRCTNVVKALLEAGFSGRPLEIWGSGRRKAQLTFVDDLAAGMVLALGRDGTYNLVSPEAVSVRSLAVLLQEHYDFEIRYHPELPEGPAFPYIDCPLPGRARGAPQRAPPRRRLAPPRAR
jgi:nucleoside-diphosphate-sugar epimerase